MRAGATKERRIDMKPAESTVAQQREANLETDAADPSRLPTSEARRSSRRPDVDQVGLVEFLQRCKAAGWKVPDWVP